MWKASPRHKSMMPGLARTTLTPKQRKHMLDEFYGVSSGGASSSSAGASSSGFEVQGPSLKFSKCPAPSQSFMRCLMEGVMEV